MADNSRNTQDNATQERIAKVIARAGLCSRRDAESWIEAGRVSINGEVIRSPARDVSKSDKILVDGKLLPQAEPPRLWRYYKPKGCVTTHKDPEGRRTVFDTLPPELPRLITVGRLDFNTEGLLLLTNDGELARHLELPSTGWARRYRVRAFGTVKQSDLDALRDGLSLNDVNYGPIEAEVERDQGDNVWITVTIREGKNREVRRVMEHLSLTVNRLIRVSFGPFILGDLEPGQIEEVKTRVLKDQLGPRLSRTLGVRREVPREERSIGPARGKPTYLRRKPAQESRPSRDKDEQPLRTRRILPMDAASGEAPKFEVVKEKPQRRAAFDKKAPFERRERGDRSENERAPKRRFEKPFGASAESGRERRETQGRDSGDRVPRQRFEKPFGARPESGRERSETQDRDSGDRAPRQRLEKPLGRRAEGRQEGDRSTFTSRKPRFEKSDRPSERGKPQGRERRPFSGARDEARPSAEGARPAPFRDNDARPKRPPFRKPRDGDGSKFEGRSSPRPSEGGWKRDRPERSGPGEGGGRPFRTERPPRERDRLDERKPKRFAGRDEEAGRNGRGAEGADRPRREGAFKARPAGDRQKPGRSGPPKFRPHNAKAPMRRPRNAEDTKE